MGICTPHNGTAIEFLNEPSLDGSQNCKLDGQKMVCEITLKFRTMCPKWN